MIRTESHRNLLLLAAALLVISCVGTPEVPAPLVPDTPESSGEALSADITMYYPLESAVLADTERTESLQDSLVFLRFDRPGSWSIYPERFLFFNGVPRILKPIQIFGSSELRRIDMILLRSETERPAGFLEGKWGKEFFRENYAELLLPEALLFLDKSYLKNPLDIRLPKDSPAYKRGMQDIQDLPQESRAYLDELGPEIQNLLADVFRLGSAGGSRRGFRSLLILPFDAIPFDVYGSYRGGIDLELTVRDETGHSDFSRMLTVLPLGRTPGQTGNTDQDAMNVLLEDVRIGDLGVFSGATPLLDPNVSGVTGEIYHSEILSKIGSSKAHKPSPVLWEGSFNAYRDERRKFLFTPGIFSYIPGKHPDISSGDVLKVTGMEQHDFDSKLRGRSVVSLQHAIYNVIPAFIAASTSPTELEIAFASNPRLRESLREFLNQDARLIWLD